MVAIVGESGKGKTTLLNIIGLILEKDNGKIVIDGTEVDRINSKKATEFRIWETKILNSYMTKGFALDDDRFLKGRKN